MPTQPRPNEFRLTLIYTLVLAAIVTVYKIVPRYLFTESVVGWNLVPMGALALFVGSRLRSRYAYLVPLAAMLVADIAIIPAMWAIGHDSMDLSTPFTYLGIVIYTLLGRTVREGELTAWKFGQIAGTGVVGSIVFFLVSNFGSWVASTDYSRTLDGLLLCYERGVPFYRNSFVSDLEFPAMFFTMHAALVYGLAPAPAPAPAEEQPA